MIGQVATAFRAGRVFLVGDAAHRTTPVGGAGMNIAIHGAHNLGWKLAWVRRGGCCVSTLDLFDGHLTVLTGPRGEPWRQAVAELAADGLPIVALCEGRDLHDEDGAFAHRYGLGETGAALVRPDGYLAWRRAGAGPDARAALRSAVGLALGRADSPARISHSAR